MTLHVDVLSATESDSELLQLVFAELSVRLPAEMHDDLDRFVVALDSLPRGLRAMAATYQLDVSLTLDDLGWHFANWPHLGYRAETQRALHELGTGELATLFDAACRIADRSWNELVARAAAGPEEFIAWYDASSLKLELAPLHERMLDLLDLSDEDGEPGLFRHWLLYARRHPERLCD